MGLSALLMVTVLGLGSGNGGYSFCSGVRASSFFEHELNTVLAINTVAKTKRIFATLVRIVFVLICYVVCRLSLLLTYGEVLPCQRANSVQVILSQFLLCQGRGILHYWQYFL